MLSRHFSTSTTLIAQQTDNVGGKAMTYYEVSSKVGSKASAAQVYGSALTFQQSPEKDWPFLV